METALDKAEKLYALDKGGMLKALSLFPQGLGEGSKAAEGLDISFKRGYRALVVTGMGGSAIGGQILSDWLLEDSPIPVQVSRGYHLPGFVDEKTLLIAVSYSGNTEETLTALEEGLRRGCQVVAITSGGAMERLSVENGIPMIKIPSGMQPRASFPWQFSAMIILAGRMGLSPSVEEEFEEALEVIYALRNELVPETPTRLNRAKELALALKGTIPFIYGPRIFEGVAYRFRTQINENSKAPASSGSFPEGFHNEVMIREAREELRRPLSLVLIRDPKGERRVERKIDAFKNLLEERVSRIVEISTSGSGKLSRILSVIYIGDYASVYLGLIYGLDPSSTDSIKTLKEL
ncbi:bifunctional phosphoglucose/phosphomannose isomerase [Candidatus Bathyarchaeota archaeon]|nr:bifunctional phosphoglucose/phosphomannose isomerase [Candidatus Bathyarchaeota archaeon]